MDVQPLPQPLVAFAEAEIARLQVPGAAIGAFHDGNVYTAAVGVTNVDHPLPVTPETLFLIGSTSKTFTATALMQLVEDGRVDLQAPVRTYLPNFRLQSEDDAARVTVRQIVTHHAGWVGDYFRDTGRGDDAIARIVAKMVNSPQLVPAGTTFSYSNAALYVAGHIVETLHGRPFEEVIRERIFEPLGMELSCYFPEQALPNRVAAGHIVTAEGPRVARPWNVPRSIAPGGGVISNVVDQVRYAAFHLGRLEPKTPIIKPETIVYMQTPQAKAGSMCEEIGITWMLDTVGVEKLVKHGGAANGHLSSFELLPSQGWACTVLTNADQGREVRNTVAAACLKHFTGLESQAPVTPSDLRPNLTEYAGAYKATLATLDVRPEGDGLRLVDASPERQLRDRQNKPLPSPPAHLRFTGPDRTAVLDGPWRGERVEFLRDPAGAIEWLRWDGRIARRLND